MGRRLACGTRMDIEIMNIVMNILFIVGVAAFLISPLIIIEILELK